MPEPSIDNPKNKEYIKRIHATVDESFKRHLTNGFYGQFRWTVFVQDGKIQNIKSQIEKTDKIEA